METLKILIDQIATISWLRCAIEEGIDFVNKRTGDIEGNENTIYKHLIKNDDTFDVPDVRCSPARLEKNILEVVGSLLVYQKDHTIITCLNAPEFASAIQLMIEKIRKK